MPKRIEEDFLAGPPARQGGPGHRAVKPDQGEATAGREREGGLGHPGPRQGLEGEVQDVARVGVCEWGPVVVEVDERASSSARWATSRRGLKTVLGQVDVVLARELPDDVAEVQPGAEASRQQPPGAGGR